MPRTSKSHTGKIHPKQLLIDTWSIIDTSTSSSATLSEGYAPIVREVRESRQHPGCLEVYGVLQRSNKKNQNGRIYPHKILMREAAKYNKVFVASKNAYGELDHPESAVVELKNTSHAVTMLEWKGEDLYGKITILPTPAGNIARSIVESGFSLGISSRGMGSVKELNEDTVEVQEDFDLVSFDLVSNPSTHGAFMRPLHESRQMRGVVLDNKYEDVDKIIHDIICEMTGVCKL